MLSVADVLKFEKLARARVVAGARGLGRQVTWMHNASVPDAPRWLNGGELVMTTIINLPPDTDQQRDYMRQLVERNVAGLIMTVGRYIQEIPQHLCDVADQYDFPLIEIPYTERFVDIVRGVNERIAQENIDTVRRALQINQSLTQIVLEGGGLPQLAQQLAQLVGHSISIETATFEMIATVNIADVDEARRYTQAHGRTNPALIEALEKGGYLPRLRATLRPVRLPQIPQVGLEMERILAPIVVHGTIYGYMWIIADDHALSDIDLLAIESGATIAALMILYQETAQNAEASLKGNLLTQLIQGEVRRDTTLIDQSLRYGVDLRSAYVMLLVDCEPTLLLSIYHQLNQLTRMQGWSAVVGQYAGQVVMLVQVDNRFEAVLGRITDSLLKERPRHTKPPRVAVSARHQGAKDVRIAHQNCSDTLAIMRRMMPNQHVVRFESLGYLHTLYLAGARSLNDNLFVAIVRRLLDERQTELLQTLEAYLDAGGNGVSTAEDLHIHRSTLNYRLSRITQVCQVDLQDPLTRMNLHVALKLLRLFAEE